jgi:hypothetical protein
LYDHIIHTLILKERILLSYHIIAKSGFDYH